LQKSLKLESYISLSNFKHQLSEQLTVPVPVHSPSVNSTPNYCIPMLLFIFCIYFWSFAPHYLYLHIFICTSITPVLMLNCNYFSSLAYLLTYLPNLTTFAQTMYIYFSIVLLTVLLFVPCVTLCCCFSRIALLYLGQVAAVDEDLFSTG
jgi:hypothetical protein